jgi:hypothetical protein
MREKERGELLALVRNAGLTALAAELEVLRSLPDEFVLRYELLWLRAFGRSVLARAGSDDNNVVSGTRRVTRVSTGQTETRGGARRTATNGHGVDVANDAALRMKHRVDRKLRSLARDIRTFMHDDDARAGMRRCSKPTCRRYAEDTWTHCPWDGFQTEEMN